MPRPARTIAVVTGSRAEYGILRTVLRAIDAHPRLNLRIIAAGMHLLRRFGHTVDDIRRDGLRVDAAVRMQADRDTPLNQAEGLGRGVIGIARALDRLRADVVLVLGDRIEAYAGAAAAVASRRILAHIHGGDVAVGDIDDVLRHSITKLAHVHFPATPDAARRIRGLGEDPWRIHRVGAPGLDEVRTLLRDRAAQRAFDPARYAPSSEYAVVAVHPTGRSAAREQRLAEMTLRAVRAAGLAAVVTYPNTDTGYTGILRAISAAARRSDVRVFPSIPRTEFLLLLRAARLLIGNSSAGIIESAFLGTPSVNVGDRQAGRVRAAPCVIDAGESSGALRRSVARALRLRPRGGVRTAYGDGRAGPRIARVLAALPLDERLRSKKIRD